MEDFLEEVRAFAKARSVKPGTVLQSAANLSGLTWDKWESGESSPTMNTVEKVRRYIRNPSFVNSSCTQHEVEETQTP